MTLFMETEIGFTSDPDLDRPLYSIFVRWDWPEDDGWTRFRLVRKINSPAVRCEEGTVLFETTIDDWGEPGFDDAAAPPSKWVYYSAFVLTPERVWRKVGDVFDIATGDHDWTMNLPESLPGVSVSKAQQVVALADAHHDLVEFLQGPGLVLDRVMSYAESLQHFWDPTKVPPNMLRALLNTLGFHLTDSLDEGRLREVAYAVLIEWPQGHLSSIDSFVRAATGYPALVKRSNNQMLTVLDSSFESTDYLEESVTPPPTQPPPTQPPPTQPPTSPPTDLFPSYAAVRDYFDTYNGVVDFLFSYDDLLDKQTARQAGPADPLARLQASNWEPLDKELLELRRYQNFPNPPAIIPVEVLDTFFLHFKKAGFIACGRAEPTRKGIPVSWWNGARGGLFARSDVAAELSMMLDLYNFDNEFLRTLTLVSKTALTTDWQWLHTVEQEPVSLQEMSDHLLIEPDSWYGTWPGRAQPQNKPHPITRGDSEVFSFQWDPNPDPAGDIVGQPDTAILARLAPVPPLEEVVFRWEMAGTTDPDMTGTMTAWRQVIMWRSSSETIPPPDPDDPTPPLPPPTDPNSYQAVLDQYPTYQAVLNGNTSYLNVYSYTPGAGVYSTQASTYNIFHGSWVSPQEDARTSELTWRPPDGVADAWWGIEVLKPEVEVMSYQKVLDENASYTDLQAAYGSYQALASSPPVFGWSKGAQHIALKAEVRAGIFGRPYWGVPVIEVSDKADIDLVVVDDV